jgi:hypothetical protein
MSYFQRSGVAGECERTLTGSNEGFARSASWKGAKTVSRCMPRRGLGLVAAAVAVWSCTRVDRPCPSCDQSSVSESEPASSAGGASQIGFCGDGIWDPQREECDDGSSCKDGRNCTNDRWRCQSTSTSACQPRSLDGCSDQCRVELGFACPEGRNCQELGLKTPAWNGEANPLARLDAGPPPVSDSGAGPRPAEPCRQPSFGVPERITGLNPGGVTGVALSAPSLSSDGRTLLFAAGMEASEERILYATRPGRESVFSPANVLINVDSGFGDGSPVLSNDGLRLYFYSQRPGGSGDRDLWLSTRDSRSADFGVPSHFAGPNSAGLDHLPWLSPDELTLMYVSTRPGGVAESDVWVAQRARLTDDFGVPELLTAISSSLDEGRAVQSRDGRWLLFASTRDGGQGGQDLWLATRDDDSSPLAPPINLSVLNSASFDSDPFLSADDRELVFSSDRNGISQLWRSELGCDD